MPDHPTMADDIPFDRTPPAAPGVVEQVSHLVRRIVAPNPGPFTFTGTCTYLVGRGRVAIVDPGPEDAAHTAAILAAIGGDAVEAILVTHTHRDHSPGAAALKARTGAPTAGAGPHRPARSLRAGEAALLDASGDTEFVPDLLLADGTSLCGPGWTLTALATPGHCANHLAFSLPEDRLLLSGDHVMGWSTSIVAPPDGAMGDYMRSLERLRGRDETIYFPGHGAPVGEPQAFVRALIHHRRMREASILAAIAGGAETVPAIVARVYAGLAPALVPAAGLNTLAHLEDLVAQGRVSSAGEVRLGGRYSVVA